MKKSFSSIFMTLLFVTAVIAQSKHSFSIEKGFFIFDGKPIELHSGELHFARVPQQYWRHRLKMMKAMGLNAVASYVFWNYHEVAPGVWDFKTENRNISQFVKTAGEEGLMVILRPGPYACAEWEFGGYPWWLLKDTAMVIRGNNPRFLNACTSYINRLSNEIKDLQITKGGPLVMVQVENEFGSYVSQRKDIPLETHRAYSAQIKKIILEAGIDVPLFTSDGSWLFKGGTVNGVLPTANGEDNIENLKKTVNEYNGGQGPYMVAEFYPGWLDHWGEKFEEVSTASVVSQTEKYLKNGVSFNFYMIHGGTNFGYTSGANYDKNHDIQPDITSYDYDAPISEAGWVTPKYLALRDLLQHYSAEPLPPIPQKIPLLTLPEIKFSKSVDATKILDKINPVSSDTLLTFEDLNQGHGYVWYSKKFKQPIHGKLEIKGLRDYALVYVNGEKVGELNRISKNYSCDIDVPFNAQLDILVENLGRINYGAEIIHNLKGILGTVTIDGTPVTGNWQMKGMPLESAPSLKSMSNSYKLHFPVFYQASFHLNKTGDTFLDMSDWGKGIVFINGHHLGRYWGIGPQQTLYLPGVWLKKGQNEVVVFEQQNDHQQVSLKSTQIPILKQLKNK
jgi:beta-galactosidase